MTPNPESQKYVTDQHILPNFQLDFSSRELAEGSELAKMFFEFPFVSGVFIAGNFVTISKKPGYEWAELNTELKNALRNFLQSGKRPVDDSLLPKDLLEKQDPAATEAEPVSKIKELLDKYIKPAVQMDGGHIELKSFDKGVVTLKLQGSCSGCPSSTLTLKTAIEGLLKRMVPEVTEVVAEAE